MKLKTLDGQEFLVNPRNITTVYRALSSDKGPYLIVATNEPEAPTNKCLEEHWGELETALNAEAQYALIDALYETRRMA